MSAPTTGMSELNIATFPTGLHDSSLLYKAKPMVLMAMSSVRIVKPQRVTCGSAPPSGSAAISSSAPPMARLYPVPAKMSIRRLSGRVIRLAVAPHSAFSAISPSPSRLKSPPCAPPMFRANIPAMPMAQPAILRVVRRSLRKNTHASSTTANTLSELSMAALEPALYHSPT